jgi:hypothetical protein
MESLPATAVDALQRGVVIDAIKIVRAERGFGLKESKDAVDRYLAEHPDLKRRLDAEQRAAERRILGRLGLLLAAIAVAVLLSLLLRR